MRALTYGLRPTSCTGGTPPPAIHADKMMQSIRFCAGRRAERIEGRVEVGSEQPHEERHRKVTLGWRDRGDHHEESPRGPFGDGSKLNARSSGPKCELPERAENLYRMPRSEVVRTCELATHLTTMPSHFRSFAASHPINGEVWHKARCVRSLHIYRLRQPRNRRDRQQHLDE